MDERKAVRCKVLSVILAATFLLHGCSLLTVGVLVEVTIDQYRPIGTFSSAAPGVIILMSLFMLVLGAAGMKGLYTEHLLLLKWFCFAAAVMVTLEFIGGFLCFLFAETVAWQFGDRLDMNVSTYRWGDSVVVNDAVDVVQSEFKCCGSRNFLEWLNNPDYECNRTDSFCRLPDSCCEKNASFCGYSHVDVVDPASEPRYRGFVYSKGCRFAFSHWVLKTGDFVGIHSLVMVTFKVICMLALGWYVQNTEDTNLIYTIQSSTKNNCL